MSDDANVHPASHWATGILLLLVATGLFGCLKEKFEPYRGDRRLPKYTEKGNQVSGALINNVAWKTHFKPFRSGRTEVFSLRNNALGDSLVVELRGEINEGAGLGKSVTFLFVIRGFQLTRLQDVEKLHETRFPLNGTRIYAILHDPYRVYSDSTKSRSNAVGALYFKRVREKTDLSFTRGNGSSYHPFIASGTFDFTIAHQGRTIEVKNGRFDFYLTDDNLILD